MLYAPCWTERPMNWARAVVRRRLRALRRRPVVASRSWPTMLQASMPTMPTITKVANKMLRAMIIPGSVSVAKFCGQ